MKMYLYVWDLVGIINENVTDEESRNALLDVLEGAGLLIEQLEQATADKNELMDGLKDMHEQLERCMGSHEKLEAACQRLKEDKRKLHAVHDENYAKAAHRAGVIEELQAANKKLVECLEWYADDENYEVDVVNQWAPIEPVSEDRGQRARQTLSEVKGNG